ncbi:hypothetical protein O0I10_006519 [Lichtheimia ornata]|uniref:Uncharacterized protein n=1 Tax=Lichtheimia ornata TaxID=688661 RepID=A0AAD7V2Q9_9FUNG|nr:uncharacterized protein O0I10_006519 [Lichtheimia ornata]KAJ8657704.1 hypothetical protein O0I10_006519 [Lichtheimia ornata]
MGSQQGPSERLNIQLGPIDEDFRPTQRFPGISRQTLSFISSSRNATRVPEARRASAEMASRNYYRETGRPLIIDELGQAWRPDDFPYDKFDKLQIEQLYREHGYH